MLDIGLLGLDTSHAESFADVLDDMDNLRLGCIWDGGAVRDESFVESYRKENGVIRYEHPREMVDVVDAAMVLTVNWDTHAELASTFLEAGIPTLIDKPITGNNADIEAIEAAAQNAPLFGGSAVPFHNAFENLPKGIPDRTLYAAGYNDYFYYRVHLTDTVRLLAGADWAQVEPSNEPGTTIDVRFANDSHATLRFDGSADGGKFSILDVADSTESVEIQTDHDTLSQMYRPYLESFAELVRGRRDDTTRVLDSASLLLAVEAAIKHERQITAGGDGLEDVEVDGGAFLSEYEPYF